jgi:hypothetical protein
MAKKMPGGRTGIIFIWVLGALLALTVPSSAQKMSDYQGFNRWGIIFEYPISFIELSPSELQKMKNKLSAELDSIIKEGRSTCGQRSIDKMTFFISQNNLIETVTKKFITLGNNNEIY